MAQHKSIYDVKSNFNSEKSREQFNKKSSFFSFYSGDKVDKESSKKNPFIIETNLNNNIKQMLNTQCSYHGCKNKISSFYSTCCKQHNFYVPPTII